MADVHEQLRALIRKRNREISVEAVIALAVGVGTCVIVFGAIFWLGYLGLWFTRPFGLKSIALASAVFTGALALVATFTAWRRIDPLDEADIQLADPNARDIQDALGFALGVPILRRDSLAGIASLIVGGPANIFDAFSLWGSLIPSSTAAVASAARVLEASRRGIAFDSVNDSRSVALLYRLGLVKLQGDSSGSTRLVVTSRGGGLLQPDHSGAKAPR